MMLTKGQRYCVTKLMPFVSNHIRVADGAICYYIPLCFFSILEIHIFSLTLFRTSKFNLKIHFQLVIFALSFKVHFSIFLSTTGRPEPFFFALDLVYSLFALCFTLMMNCCC